MRFGDFMSSFCGAGVLAAGMAILAACAPKHYVRVQGDSIVLSLEHPGAKEVLFASSIDRFQLHPATRAEGNSWKISVPKADEFTYFYLVDNAVTLPDCQFTVSDDFGAENCLFDIGM